MIHINPEKLRVPAYISPERFRTLKWKEQDYILLREAGVCKKDMRRALYFYSRTGFNDFQSKVEKIIQEEARKHIENPKSVSSADIMRFYYGFETFKD